MIYYNILKNIYILIYIIYDKKHIYYTNNMLFIYRIN